MAHAIEMFFDEQADAAVRALWQQLATAGLPSLATRTHRRHRPHVSLTVTESLDQADLAPVRSALAGPLPAVLLDALATFPGSEGALFLATVVTADLLTLHTRVHQALSGQPVTHWPYYLPGRWVPHCTLAQGLGRDEIAAAFRVLHGYQPIAAQVTSAGITDTMTGAVTPLTA
jgi:2'-5' RNA ligase superfamily